VSSVYDGEEGKGAVTGCGGGVGVGIGVGQGFPLSSYHCLP
jgi:hypothetical protein